MDANKRPEPWQYFPERFVRFASQFENSDDEFEQIIAYLMLDVGVETLCKVYLLMTDTDVIKYKKREGITNGTISKNMIPDSGITAVDFDTVNFHVLVESVKRVSNSKISDKDFKRAEYFHKLRNNIYHQGVKSLPSKKDFLDYLTLAKSLLQKLLDIEWENQEQETNHAAIIDELNYLFLSSSRTPRIVFRDLCHNIEIASVIVRPIYATRSFQDSLFELSPEVDALSGIPYDSSIYEFAKTEVIQKFNRLTGTKITDTKFILKSCFDVTYLQFAVLLSKMREDVFDELEKYVGYYDFSRKPMPNYDEITQEYMDDWHGFIDWVNNTREKINSWFEQNIAKEQSSKE